MGGPGAFGVWPGFGDAVGSGLGMRCFDSMVRALGIAPSVHPELHTGAKWQTRTLRAAVGRTEGR